MPTWPSTLPQRPPLEGFREHPGATVIRTPMEVGPPKHRPRYTHAITLWSMIWELDGDQLTTLQTFYEQTLGHGTVPFDFPHPRTGAVTVVQYAGEPPSYRNISGNLWQVTMRVEVLP